MTQGRPHTLGVLTWNLYHGRDRAPDPSLHTWRSRLLRVTERGGGFAQVNRPLLEEFSGLIASWDWDLALLQEAPPRWLAPLGRRCSAGGVLALTSRNSLAPLRAMLADLNPDLIASNEGGSNMLLARSPSRIEEVQRITLTERPERRRMLLARVGLGPRSTIAVACLHLSVPETGRGAGEVLHAAELAAGFAGSDPLILGGDLNLRPAEEPRAFADLRERFALAPPTAPRAIDHLLAKELEIEQAPRALPPAARQVRDRSGLMLQLSDHAPVTARLRVR